MTEQQRVPDSPSDGARRRDGTGTAVLGAILIAVGIIFLIGQQFQLDWGGEAWPFYVIAPGLVLLAFGLTQPRGAGLTIAGSIVAIVGLILLYQNITDHWESWAYAWALVGPGGSGVGMLLYGTRSGNAKMAREGFWQVVTALGLFVAGFVFFEGLIGLSGDRWNLPEWALPAVIIGLGVLVLIRAVTSGAGPDAEDRGTGGAGF
ncbi:MAG TPA: hypothetical protein VK838_01535 [Candidatus Limnocylindrales bacterium]|nr:hypothetical protein [Candidatus Limnocylindrales bacterium]